MSWTVTAEAPVQEAPDANWRLAMDVDPRARRLSLGLRIASGAEREVQTGAVARSFFAAPRADWGPAVAWLRGAEAGALLDELAAGYSCEIMWSGDAAVSWSDEAWLAGRAIYERVCALIGADPTAS